MPSAKLDALLVKELKDIFDEFSTNDKLGLDQLGDVFKACQSPQPNFRLREIIKEYDINKDGLIDFDEFRAIFEAAGTNKVWGSKLRENIKSRAGVETLKTHEKSAEGTKHTFIEGEIKPFANYVSFMLKNDPDVGSRIPIKEDKQDLFNQLSDGVILCKLANRASENTIDERTINLKKLNQFTITENLNLAINSFKAIGLHIVNVGAQDIINKTQHLILGIVWQIIKKILLKNINLQYTPGLACLLREGETITHLQTLSKEDLLMRWVNYHLERSGSSRTIQNFGTDLQDSEVLSILAHRVLPVSNMTPVSDIMNIPDLYTRAGEALKIYERADLDAYLTADDVTKPNSKLNLIFIAQVFNNYPCLEEPAEPIEIIEETREEKTYRNWMNSLGVKPIVNYLYSDLHDGTVILQLIEIIEPGSVDKKRVNNRPMKPATANLLKLENCNYVVEISKKIGVSLVGTAGDDIVSMNLKLLLGLVSQLMRMYTFNMLRGLTDSGTRIDDSSIVKWANDKSSVEISSFKDSSISTSKPLCALIEAIQPQSINFEYLNDASNYEEKLANAGYAISCARKIGATVYTLAEDVAESNSKMIMTMYACLMVRDIKGSS